MGTPLESIKAGRLFAVNSIVPQPGFPSHLLTLQVKPQGLPTQSPPIRSLYHPSIPQVQAWTANPRLLCSCTRTPLLLQRMPLCVPLIGPAHTFVASSSTSSTLPPLCLTPICPMNPPTAPLLTLQPPTRCLASSPPTIPTCRPIPWLLYLPPNHPSTPSPSAASPRDWSRPSKSEKNDTATNYSQPTTVTSNWKTSLLSMKKATALLPKATRGILTTQTSRSRSEKGYTALPSGSKWLMKAWCWPTPKSKAPSPIPILSLSMLPPSFHQSPLTPFPSGSTNFPSASQLSFTCSPMLPRNWTIGVLLLTSLTIGSTTTSWPILTRVSSSSRPKRIQSGLPSCSAKGDSKWQGCPSSWHIWSALRQSLCTVRGATMGLKSPSKGVGNVKHKVVLS